MRKSHVNWSSEVMRRWILIIILLSPLVDLIELYKLGNMWGLKKDIETADIKIIRKSQVKFVKLGDEVYLLSLSYKYS